MDSDKGSSLRATNLVTLAKISLVAEIFPLVFPPPPLYLFGVPFLSVKQNSDLFLNVQSF